MARELAGGALIHPLPGTFRPEEIALHERWVGVFDWVGGAAFLASVGLFWYTRRSQRGPRFLLELALGYEVFITLNIGILNYAVGHPAGEHRHRHAGVPVTGDALGEAVDQRTDLYALGGVAYWMLTGRYVFTGDSSIQVVARHVSSAPEAPSRHSPFDISQALDVLVLDCLRKKPSERPASARELCDRLGQCVEEPWTREGARIWWETRMVPEDAVSLVD